VGATGAPGRRRRSFRSARRGAVGVARAGREGAVPTRRHVGPSKTCSGGDVRRRRSGPIPGGLRYGSRSPGRASLGPSLSSLHGVGRFTRRMDRPPGNRRTPASHARDNAEGLTLSSKGRVVRAGWATGAGRASPLVGCGSRNQPTLACPQTKCAGSSELVENRIRENRRENHTSAKTRNER
jgi:hypothetical protein